LVEHQAERQPGPGPPGGSHVVQRGLARLSAGAHDRVHRAIKVEIAAPAGGHGMQPGDPASARETTAGLVENEARREPPHGGSQPLVSGVRHLDQKPQDVVGVLVERGVERIEVELTDLRRQFGELRVLGQLRPPGGTRRGLPLPRFGFVLSRGCARR
jgi:hypothetical protein